MAAASDRCRVLRADTGSGGGDEAEEQSRGHGNGRVVWRGLRTVLGKQRGGECHVGISHARKLIEHASWGRRIRPPCFLFDAVFLEAVFRCTAA